jgi:hypothetical protein
MTEWKVEGTAATTKIVAVCLYTGCNRTLSYAGSVAGAKNFTTDHTHPGVSVEKIPMRVWQEYRDKKVGLS